MSTTIEHPMMACGHTANAVRVHSDGSRAPSCAICCCERIAETTFDLAGRMASCYCGKTRPSTRDGSLAFFQYRGPGMPNPNCVQCGYFETVHQPINPHTGRPGITDHAFVARVFETDSFYCGCNGWD